MNNMDRRAFLAFVLSMLLFIAFYWYYSPVLKKNQQRSKELAEQKQVEDSLAALRVDRQAGDVPLDQPLQARTEEFGAPIAATPLVQTGDAGEVVVNTSLYRVTISEAGAEITSCELTNYHSAGQPVQLISQPRDTASTGPRGVGNLIFVGRDRRLPLSNVLFEAHRRGYSESLPDRAEINLGEASRETELVFLARGESGEEIERYYRFTDGSYVIRSGVRFAASSFPFVRKLSWGMGEGLRSTEVNQADDYMNFQGSFMIGEVVHRRKPKDFGKVRSERKPGTVRWAALQTKYFIAALMPRESVGGEVELAGRKEDNMITASLELPAAERGGRIEQEISIYMGPLDFKLLKSMGLGLEKNVNMGYKLIRPVSWVILWSLIALYKVIPNYGVVIILLSVFTKILFYRLTHKSFKSMRDMQSLQPKLQALKEKYKDDKPKLSSETMKLYKAHGVNPLGGCLPLLLQAPVFIALFSVLKFTIEVRGAHFVGWISDLSQQDILLMLPFALPVIGKPLSVLPILMGAAMLLQTKIGGSITGSSPSAAQPKAFTYLLPIVFTFIFYKMPSGLVLYWLVNNVLSIGQQYYINKDVREDKKDSKDKEAPTKKTKRQPAKKKER